MIWTQLPWEFKQAMLQKTDLIDAVKTALARPWAASSDFDLNKGFQVPADRVLRPASVLVGIIDQGTGPAVILTKRAAALKHHPGQIAFPGGKVDATDVDGRAAALRESDEEIGLRATQTDIIGTLPTHDTVTNFQVTPYVALVEKNFSATPERGEVDEVFTVPLTHLMNVENYVIEHRFWQGQKRFFYTVPYGPYYVWGATARMLRGLAEQVKM